MVTDQTPVPSTDDAVPMRRLATWCEATAPSLGAAGLVLALRAGPSDGFVVLGSGADARQWAEVERDLGEGPTADAYALQRPVLSPDFHRGIGPSRWPTLRESIGDRVCAVFAFPMSVGAARFGVLTVYYDRPLDHLLEGPDAVIGAGLSCAARATLMIVDELSGSGEGLPDEDAGAVGGLSDEMGLAVGARSEIYQAQGMIMVDLSVSLVEAIVRLRGHAFSTGRSVSSVASEVVRAGLILIDDREAGHLDGGPDRADGAGTS